ncbi:MAG TPA: alkaline phosphatase family protein [Tepidisphaeraceae bacterium]|jgi:hypothetical protein
MRDRLLNRHACHPWILIVLLGLVAGGCTATSPSHRAGTADNLIIVTLDGFRWQEVFGGLDSTLNTKQAGGVADPKGLKEEFARDSVEHSRAAILPFFWDVVAKEGQVFGDRSLKNVAHVTNPFRFSYPGYSEMLCGYADPKVDSNDYPPNPNVTVLEWLNHRPGFESKVVAYGAWNRLGPIINSGRSGVPAIAGWDPIRPFHGASLTEREKVLNDLLARTTRLWPDEPPDSIVEGAALDAFIRHKPRVFYVMLGETDEWAHGRRYDLYLESAKRSDEFIKRLWETAQSMPQYAGRTALVITTDHGRGSTPKDWTDHGEKVPGADGWWAAMMGPGVEARGVIGEGEETQRQIAATLAALLGQDYRAAQPRAATALPVRSPTR